MKIDGSCFCGAITYEAELDADKVVICNCTDCQTLSGSAFRTVGLVREGSFKLLTGTPKDYVKIAESGTPRAQGFCPDCGTPIYSVSVGDGPQALGVRLGTARQRDELVPQFQVWTRSAQHWLGDLGSLRKVEKQ